MIIQPQMNVSDSERDRRVNMALLEQRLSDDFSLEPNQHEYPVQTQVIRRYMSSTDGGSGQGREREGDPSAVSESSDLQVAPPLPPHESKRGQKRSPSGSSVSDDSLSPPPVKVNFRCT